MHENPRYLPFLRDLAKQDWPSYDVTRGILADRLDEDGDRRADRVRAAVPDLWQGGSWHRACHRDEPPMTSIFRAGGYKGARQEVSPRSRYEVLQHFLPMFRVKVSGGRHGCTAMLQVATFGLWVSFADHRPDRCWRDVALLVDRTSLDHARAEAEKHIKRHPEEDWELVLPPG